MHLIPIYLMQTNIWTDEAHPIFLKGPTEPDPKQSKALI